MNELTWDGSLSVQVDEIEEDHRRLVDLFNILNRSVQSGGDMDYIRAVLDELVSCTVWHFKHEERLMLLYHYPLAGEHKQEHEELLAAAGALQERLLGDVSQMTEEDIAFLEKWLTGHILSADMELGSALAAVM